MSLSSTTWFANTNSSGVTLTFNKTQYPDEFQALKNYFEQGNNTLIIYANETKLLTDVDPLYTYT
jgi:anthranilate/para-aminobenzoate synthase component I